MIQHVLHISIHPHQNFAIFQCRERQITGEVHKRFSPEFCPYCGREITDLLKVKKVIHMVTIDIINTTSKDLVIPSKASATLVVRKDHRKTLSNRREILNVTDIAKKVNNDGEFV